MSEENSKKMVLVQPTTVETPQPEGQSSILSDLTKG
jgi:hypothetical protein